MTRVLSVIQSIPQDGNVFLKNDEKIKINSRLVINFTSCGSLSTSCVRISLIIMY